MWMISIQNTYYYKNNYMIYQHKFHTWEFEEISLISTLIFSQTKFNQDNKDWKISHGSIEEIFKIGNTIEMYE